MSGSLPVFGTAKPPFGVVEAAFADVLSSQNGAQYSFGGGGGFAAFVEGQCVIDLWGGYADRKQSTPWPEDALPCVFSTGKAVLAVLIAEAVAAGQLRYDMPVAEIWPAFAAHGKEAVTVDQVMSHQAGLPGFSEPMDGNLWTDWRAICTKLAEMAPIWPPGTANGYHPQTYGFLAGEILRLATGKSVGEHLRARTKDVICGAKPSDLERLAAMQKPPRPPDLGEINPETEIAFLKPWSSAGGVKTEARYGAEIPASNMLATAKGLAGFVHGVANAGTDIDGEVRLDSLTIDAMSAERCHRPDRVLPFTLSWAAGVMRNSAGHYGPNPAALGHYGFGGAVIVIDTSKRLSLAFTPNAMSPHLVGDPRAIHLIEAVYDAL